MIPATRLRAGPRVMDAGPDTLDAVAVQDCDSAGILGWDSPVALGALAVGHSC